MAKSRTIGACVTTIVLCIGLAVAAAAEIRVLVARGSWVLLPDGEPPPTNELQRGLQTSGLAWDGNLLWSVGDQRASFPGHLYAIDPQSARLVRPPIPLIASDPLIQSRLEAWQRLDLEDIAILSATERRFVTVLEDKAMAALVVQFDDQTEEALVAAIWEFQFPADLTPEPFRHDPNYRLEGIAIDDVDARGYVAFERDLQGVPQLYQFDLQNVPISGIGPVRLEQLRFSAWDRLRGKVGALVNANGLQLIRTPSGAPRLFVLCRDREMFFVLDPHSGRLVDQVELSLRSPDGEAIEWASPEGIAVDSQRGVLYIISDPDSTDGNFRLRDATVATRRFAQFVPLLFQFELPPKLMR